MLYYYLFKTTPEYKQYKKKMQDADDGGRSVARVPPLLTRDRLTMRGVHEGRGRGTATTRPTTSRQPRLRPPARGAARSVRAPSHCPYPPLVHVLTRNGKRLACVRTRTVPAGGKKMLSCRHCGSAFQPGESEAAGTRHGGPLREPFCGPCVVFWRTCGVRASVPGATAKVVWSDGELRAGAKRSLGTAPGDRR